MESRIERAIVKTLAYADIFDYPLKVEEIWRWLINVKCQMSNVKSIIIKEKLTQEKSGFYFLKRRSNIVSVRKKREKWSNEKLRTAQKITSLLHFIPFVKLVGITGGLAVNNAKKDDDIDLLVISGRNLLWTTRFLVTLLIELIGVRRHPNQVKTDNKICLNMFMDEDHLNIPKNERDLFSAHEVVQMKPIYDINQTYQKFLQANMWVIKYLPNSLNLKSQISNLKSTNQISKLIFHLLFSIFYFPFTEKLLKHLQILYMYKRRTTEVISDGLIRFHPQDARVWVMEKYKNKIHSYLNYL